MTKPRVAIRLLVPLLAAGLFACQSTPEVLSTANFQLGPDAKPLAAPNNQAPTRAAVQSHSTTSGALVAPAKTMSASGGSGLPSHADAPSTQGGTVTVDLTSVMRAMQVAGHYRVLATAADIDHLVVTLSMPGQPNLVQVVTASQITGGQSTVTFSGLPTGTATITIVAYDASGYSIGSTTQTTPVTNGVSSTTAVNVPIDPSASPTSTGSSAVTINLNFATPPPTGTVLATFDTPAKHLFADDLGHYYAEGGACSGNYENATSLFEFSATDGSLLEAAVTGTDLITSFRCFPYAPVAYASSIKTLYFAEMIPASTIASDPVLVGIQTIVPRAVAADSSGIAYYVDNGMLTKRALDGTISPTGVPVANSVAIDPSDDFWVNESAPASAAQIVASVSEYTSAGALKGTYPLPFAPNEIKAGGDGSVWLTDGSMITPGTALVKVSPSGTVGSPIPMVVDDYCIDANNNVWVATGSSLVKLASDGTQLGSYPLAAFSVASGSGYIFAGVQVSTYVQQVDEVAP